jgi:hypothetical protein
VCVCFGVCVGDGGVGVGVGVGVVVVWWFVGVCIVACYLHSYTYTLLKTSLPEHSNNPTLNHSNDIPGRHGHREAGRGHQSILRRSCEA